MLRQNFPCILHGIINFARPIISLLKINTIGWAVGVFIYKSRIVQSRAGFSIRSTKIAEKWKPNNKNSFSAVVAPPTFKYINHNRFQVDLIKNVIKLYWKYIDKWGSFPTELSQLTAAETFALLSKSTLNLNVSFYLN